MTPQRLRRFMRLAGASVALSALAILFVVSSLARRRRTGTATYVGSGTCMRCHAAKAARWRGSHHDLAMQPATDSTVAGSFSNARFTYAGVTTTFSRRSGRFVVRTDGPDGVLRDYEVQYTFGVKPLQQYLIELDGGRLQALSIAWDARPKAAGGQRWFHLYPGQHISHTDELHWTGIRQNWNYMCADCHSTGVKKNYDPATNQFATTFTAVNVGCESCHGPGSRHIASRGKVAFSPITRANEVERCARCHSRRGAFTDDYTQARKLGDTHRVALLDDQLYDPDGQIRDEVFEYGSFVQSKMYSKGVICSDCHDPHTAKLRAPGSQVCARCHMPDRYQSPAHHFHAAGSRGADCIGCHMPTRTYMVVDPRHDHSIRIPQPDLSVSLGVPNACTKCHTDRDATWAARIVEAWYGHAPRGYQRYASAFAASARGDTSATRLLSEIASDRDQPAIARASALQRLGPLIDGSIDGALSAVRAGLSDGDAIVRRGAVAALAGADSLTRARLLPSLLADSDRVVRMDATRALAGVAGVNADELIAADRFNADRPESRLNLSLVYMAQRRFDDAEKELRAALEIEPRFVPALVNLADLYRLMDRDTDAERALRSAVAIDSASPAAHHALGLFFVRQRRLPESLPELSVAERLAPEVARYGVVYALALDDAGRRDQADDVLTRVVTRHPFDREVLSMLVKRRLERRDRAGALVYARRLAALEPANAEIQALVQQLAVGRGN
jgi:predicted CXXCH cytochrome family protein